MCDNSAVSWSELESEQQRTRVDTKNKIVADIRKFVAHQRQIGAPELFAQGMERVLDYVELTPVTPAPLAYNDPEYRLF